MMMGDLKDEILNDDFGGSKYGMIQKDIGYSSDADMSDAMEPHANKEQNNLSTRTLRKRHIKRRRSRASSSGTRPWSFHSDWTDWDYYQTPLNFDNASSENLDDTDEHTVRKLIEFGENYESWIRNDELIRVSPIMTSQSSSENEPKSSIPTIEEVAKTNSLVVKKINCVVIEPEQDEAVPVSVTTRETQTHSNRASSSVHLSISIFIWASLLVLAFAVCMANNSPQIQISYPHRPPPI